MSLLVENFKQLISGEEGLFMAVVGFEHTEYLSKIVGFVLHRYDFVFIQK